MNNKLGLTPIKPPQGGFIGVKMVNLVVPKKNEGHPCGCPSASNHYTQLV